MRRFLIWGCPTSTSWWDAYGRKNSVTPSNWARTDALEAALEESGLFGKEIGELWVRKESSPWLEVPSATLPTEVTYLINPHHWKGPIEVADVNAYRFDERLLRPREET